MKQGLYIHIPFCANKCAYCAFYSVTNRQELTHQYIQALKHEIKAIDTTHVTTIYIGGGTPSLLQEVDMADLFQALHHHLSINRDAEITIEANPESVTESKLKLYQQLGINRLSLGLQAWQDRLLISMGRPHSQKDFLNVYTSARSIGFKSINVDAIFGYPTQTLDEWHETLEQITQLAPDHVSCYSLEVDNNSRLAALIRAAKEVLPSETLDRRMYHAAKIMLANRGYHHYELSNFSKPGHQCRHNLNFWHHHQYIGLGAGAHSFIQKTHFHHPENMQAYMNNPTLKIEHISLSPYEDKVEWLIKRLRLTAGFTSKEYYDSFTTSFETDFASQVAKLLDRKLIQANNNQYSCTELGFDLHNQVTAMLLK